MPEEIKTHKLQLQESLLEAIQNKANSEDENTSSLIRRVMADYVGWVGNPKDVGRTSQDIIMESRRKIKKGMYVKFSFLGRWIGNTQQTIEATGLVNKVSKSRITVIVRSVSDPKHSGVVGSLKAATSRCEITEIDEDKD